MTVSAETARRYLAAREWPWTLTELDGAWQATHRDQAVDTLLERYSPTLAGLLQDIEKFEEGQNAHD